MADAILKGRSTLAPANLRQLQWVPGSAQFTHVVNNRIVRVRATDQKTDTLDILPALNAALAGLNAAPLEVLPAISWWDTTTCWFRTEQEAYTWSTAGALQKKNAWPAGATQLDIQEKTLNAAYLSGEELRVSLNGVEKNVAHPEADGIVYGKPVHQQEFGIDKGTFWSPSGRFLAFYRMDERMVTPYPIYILDSMPAQPRFVRYPFAGAKSHHVTVGVYDTETEKTLYLQTGEPADQYLTNLAWTPDERSVLIAVVNRAQDHLRFNRYDAATGAFIKTLFEEKNDKWVEPEKPAVFVPGTPERFIWQSERDGFNHLYLYDLSGSLIRKLSDGAAPVTNFYGFSADGSTCFYQMADESGLNRYAYKTDLKSGISGRLSEDEGTHNCLISSSGAWVLDQFSNIATPRFIYLYPAARPTGRQIVFGAKNPLDGYQLGLTNLFSLPSSTGERINARMVLPPDFSSAKKYPAIVYVYNGPKVQMVANSWLGGADLWMHRLAQEGFVVFSVDGHGSANRGFVFESAIHRQLGQLELDDQMQGISYLRNQFYIDSTRIGVYGWSYGGFMTTSLMSRPEARSVFKCGVAGGPVIDWRMYEVMYTERYMDTPQENPEGYAKNNLFNYIDRLKGRLLMIHGSSDEVVLWQHSLRYIRECVRKGKQIDYFVYPEHRHNITGNDRVHLFEKIERFFKENL